MLTILMGAAAVAVLWKMQKPISIPSAQSENEPVRTEPGPSPTNNGFDSGVYFYSTGWPLAAAVAREQFKKVNGRDGTASEIEAILSRLAAIHPVLNATDDLNALIMPHVRNVTGYVSTSNDLVNSATVIEPSPDYGSTGASDRPVYLPTRPLGH